MVQFRRASFGQGQYRQVLDDPLLPETSKSGRFSWSFRLKKRHHEIPQPIESSESSRSSITSSLKSSLASKTPTFQCKIPDGVAPGEMFYANAGQDLVQVKCPSNCIPGQTIEMQLPMTSNTSNSFSNAETADTTISTTNTIKESNSNECGSINTSQSNNNRRRKLGFSLQGLTNTESSSNSIHSSSLCSWSSSTYSSSIHDSVKLIPRSDPPAYMVRIPKDARIGDNFEVMINGSNTPITVKVPKGARPGYKIRVVPPVPIIPEFFAPPPPPPIPPPPPPPPPRARARTLSADTTGKTTIPPPPPPPPPSQPPPRRRRRSSSVPSRRRSSSAPMDTNILHHMTSPLDYHQLSPPPPPPLPPPPPPPLPLQNHKNNKMNHRSNNLPENRTLQFQVVVPEGVEPGQTFTILANGTPVLVTCPLNAHPGKSVRFRVPSVLLDRQHEQEQHPSRHHQMVTSPIACGKQQIRLQYFDNADGWTRIIRLEDQKFQWVRTMDDGRSNTGDVRIVDCNNHSLAVDQRAFCRWFFNVKDDNIDEVDDNFKEKNGNNKKNRLSFVSANEATVHSSLKHNNKRIVSYKEIASVQRKRLEDKQLWFQSICEQLRSPYEEGHIQIQVRREFLIEDSMNAILGMSVEDLRRTWRFHFIKENGLDAGGLTRDWFQNVTETLFNPSYGLFRSSPSNQLCLEVNPYSEACCGSDHLNYFRFVGRVMGRALLEGQLVTTGHLVPYLYKHILGWPITLSDLKHIDEEFWKSMKNLAETSKTITAVAGGSTSDNYVQKQQQVEIADLCLDFTITQDVMGEKQQIELVEGGSLIAVDDSNVTEFIEACIKYKTLNSVQEQLYELLSGFYDVIPEPLLTVFDVQELELVLCGLPNIDIEDWKSNTDYTGVYIDNDTGSTTTNTSSSTTIPLPCRWFWEVVSEYDQEMRARLLQFVTGTAGVPSQGFSALLSHDGHIRKFTIEGVDRDRYLYPRSHTCFNRLDLPIYTSKTELKERLTEAILASSRSGFGFE